MKNLNKILFSLLLSTMISPFTSLNGMEPLEIIPETEEADALAVGELFVDKSKKEKKEFKIKSKRGSNSYGHGCVRAEFKVLEDIEQNLKHGIFSNGGKKYQTIMRFSNPSYEKLDSEKTFRGVGIKIFGVEGEKLLSYDSKAITHDFLLVAYPEFPVKNVAEMRELMEALIVHKNPIWFFIPSVYKPWTWRFRQFNILLRSKTYQPRTHLFAHKFFSILPFKLGEHQQVRYRINPCRKYEKEYPEGTSGRFFRDRMVEHLNNYEACYDFSVQLRKEGMGIEDGTELWDTNVSPYINVARITIPKQKFDTEEKLQYCELMSFNPWHAIETHRPLGSLNRARKISYEASTTNRRGDYEDAPEKEPIEFPALFEK